MNSFQIILQRGGEKSWPIVAMDIREKENLSQRSEGRLELDLQDLRGCIDPKDYGMVLGRALFRDQIRDAYVRALTYAHNEKNCLRVLLTVEDPALRALHWERVCAPVNGVWDFLSLNQDTPFALNLPSQTDRNFPPIGKRDLSALALVAGPQDLNGSYGLPPMDLPEAVKLVHGALNSIPCDILAATNAVNPGAADSNTLRLKGPPNLNNLCEQLTAGRYTILHILCHGAVREGETLLYLPGDNNRPITGSELIERLSRVSGQRGLPQLVFLMACEGASPEAENGLGGLAQRMVRELGIPAVLAMTSPVSIATGNALAKPFYQRLFTHGEPDRALVEALASLQGRLDVTVPAIFSRLEGRPLFNESIDRKLSPTDIQYGADRLCALIETRAPVLKGETEVLADRLRRLPAAEGLSLDARQDRGAVLERANQLSLEALDLSFNALALDQPVPDYDARCPFRGLDPFRLEDREFFFGRETLLDDLVRRLDEYPFLAVLGDSGSGKSSLVRAGLLPRLNTCGEAICITPGSQPVAQLGAALTARPNCTALIIDQFEEIFTLCHDESQRQTFIDGLLAQKENRRIVLALRADFWGECAPYTRLKEEMERRQELLAPLNIPGMRRVMEQQAAKVGLRFEGGLAEMILDEVTNEPGAMCLLQHALLRLWERRHGRLLCVKEYNTIGGVGKAIAQSADKIYDGFDAADKERVRDIFLRLTRLDPEISSGHEHRDTRRRVEMRELVPAGGSSEAITNLVAHLADGRLVVTSSNRATGQDEVEVAHEALIRYWPRLRNWLEEDRAGLRLRESIRTAAQDWEKTVVDPTMRAAGLADLLIHRGPRLDEALALPRKQHIALNEQEQRYLDACLALRVQEQEDEKRKSRRLVRFVSWVAVLMCILAAISIFSAWGARESARQAGQDKARAESAVTAQAHTLSTAQAARFEAEVAKNEAVSQKGTADASRQQAVNARATAVAALEDVERSKNYAQQQAQTARSRELAAVSMAHQGDNIDLALLLAVEGWNHDHNFDTQNALLSGVMSSLYMEQIMTDLPGAYPVLVFNQAGTRLAAGGSDGKVYLVDTNTNKLVAVMESGAKQPIASLAFSPNGTLLASSDETGINLWDGQNGKRKDQLAAGDSPQVAFFDDNTLYASADINLIRYWDLTTKRRFDYYPVSPLRKVTCMAFSSKGQLAIGTEHGAYLWYVERWKQDRDWVYLATDDRVKSLSFSSGGLTLAVSEENHKGITLWDTSGNKKNRIFINTSNVQMAFMPDGPTAALAYVAPDNSIMLVDPLTGKALQPPMRGHVGPINALAFGPNGQLASDGEDRFILWNSETGRQYSRSLEAPAPIRAFAISSDGATLAVVDQGNIIHFYPVEQVLRAQADPGVPAKEKDQYKPDAPARALALNKDGLLAVGTDDRLLLFDAQHKLVDTILTGWKPGQMLFSQDGKTLVAVDPKNGLIAAWDAQSRNMTRKDQIKPFDSFTLTTDGRYLVTAWEKGHVQVRDALSGQVLFDRFQLAQEGSGDPKDSEGIWSQVNPDGTFLYIHDYLDGELRVLYIPTQQQVYALTGWAFKPGDQVVSPDGFMSVSRSSDRVLSITSLDPNTLMNFDCQKAGRNLTQPEWATFFPGEDYRSTCPQWDAGN